MIQGVWLITGVQASGKSTIANLLARQNERAVHVRGGQFYRWAVSGWTHPTHELSDEARRMLTLRYGLSAYVADQYCQSGFVTVAQDNIFGEDVRTWLDSISSRPRHLVVLRPSIEAVHRRDAQRQRLTGKIAYRAGELTIEDLDDLVGAIPKIGLWLDNSNQQPLETVAEIVRRQCEATID